MLRVLDTLHCGRVAASQQPQCSYSTGSQRLPFAWPTAWRLGLWSTAGVCCVVAAPYVSDVLERFLMRRAAGEASQEGESALDRVMNPVAACTAWLASAGAVTEAVSIRPSQAAADAGWGLFASEHIDQATRLRWWQRLPLSTLPLGTAPPSAAVATYPWRATITADTIVRCPTLGGEYGQALERELLDERTLIMVYLLVERKRGSASPLAPYLALLPQSFNTPLYFSPSELKELAGTPLAAAAGVVRSRLRSTWEQLAPGVTDMLRRVGVQEAPTFDDFLWAHTVFWSRGHSLPVPRRPGASTTDALADGVARRKGGGSRGGSGGGGEVDVFEGIVPGLDFCNHRPTGGGANCWWEVVRAKQPQRRQGAASTGGPGGSSSSSSSSGSSSSSSSSSVGLDGVCVELRCSTRHAPRPGDELFISYGDKSNEELLLLYGFAEAENPHEYVMLPVPVPPPAEWDPVMRARMELLRARGLKPQLFLSAADLLPSPHQARLQQKTKHTKDAAADAAATAPAFTLPVSVLQTLQAFILTPQELAAQLEAPEEEPSGRSGGSGGGVSVAALARAQAGVETCSDREALGLLMGCLATLVKLLEARAVQMEGPQGSGSLEDDLARIVAAAASSSSSSSSNRPPPVAAAAAVTPSSSIARGSETAISATLPPRQWAALLYRAGQKRLAREYLVRCRRMLQAVMARLQQLE